MRPLQIPRVDSNDAVQSDAESVAGFFAATCAAGTNDDGPLLGGGKFDGMCTACKVGQRLRLAWAGVRDAPRVPGCAVPASCQPGKGFTHGSSAATTLHPLVPPWPQGDCSPTDAYADYAGTIRGIMEGACECGPWAGPGSCGTLHAKAAVVAIRQAAHICVSAHHACHSNANTGDVAFTKHTTALEVPKDGSKPEAWATAAKADLRLLCKEGGCKSLDEYESCNIARVPARAGKHAQRWPACMHAWLAGC